jgi:hypothetical protein
LKVEIKLRSSRPAERGCPSRSSYDTLPSLEISSIPPDSDVLRLGQPRSGRYQTPLPF